MLYLVVENGCVCVLSWNFFNVVNSINLPSIIRVVNQMRERGGRGE